MKSRGETIGAEPKAPLSAHRRNSAGTDRVVTRRAGAKRRSRQA